MRAVSLIYSICIVLLALVFTACNQQETSPNTPPIRYLALGDSYTIGQGVEATQRWPNQLSEKLVENGFEVTNTTIIAKTGWKTDDLLKGIADTLLTDYNLVSLLIGVNNQFWGQSVEQFSSEFDALLNKSIMLSGSQQRVFVLSIPDYGVTPFGSRNREQIALKLDEYNDYIRQKCASQNIPFIDVTTISRQLGDSLEALAMDNLHPSSRQYEEWVEKVLPEVVAILME